MIAFLAAMAAFQQKPTLAVDGLDPVALCQGKRIKGEEGRTAKFELYTYAFASDANRKKFESDPVRYGIQISGACANMGPLSGRGAITNWAVHKGRIYIFASGSCKKAFLSNPDAFIDRPNRPLAGSSAAQSDGNAWIAKAVDAHGGWKAIGAIDRIFWREHVVAKSGNGSTYWFDNSYGFGFPRAHYRAQTWEGGGVHSMAVGEEGWQRGAEPSILGDWERGYLIRENLRNPIVLLRLSRDPQFRAYARDSATNEFGEVRVVDTQIGGSVTTLFLDSKTSQIVGSRYFGRPGGGANRWLTVRYYDYREVAGVKISFQSTTDWPGRTTPAPTVAWKEVRINSPQDASIFNRAETVR